MDREEKTGGQYRVWIERRRLEDNSERQGDQRGGTRNGEKGGGERKDKQGTGEERGTGRKDPNQPQATITENR